MPRRGQRNGAYCRVFLPNSNQYTRIYLEPKEATVFRYMSQWPENRFIWPDIWWLIWGREAHIRHPLNAANSVAGLMASTKAASTLPGRENAPFIISHGWGAGWQFRIGVPPARFDWEEDGRFNTRITPEDLRRRARTPHGLGLREQANLQQYYRGLT